MLLAVLLLLQTATPPRTAAAAAYHAVEGDSVAAVRTRWQGRLQHDPTDRGTRLGLAALDWLTFDYTAANSGFNRLLTDDSTDHYALYARLGLAETNLWRVSFAESAGRFSLTTEAARRLGDSAVAAEAQTLLGFLRSRIAGMPSALATLDSAERLMPAGNDTLIAFLECTRAPIETFAGLADARLAAARGLARARAVGNHRMMGLCYQATAEVAINVNTAVAEAYLDSAEAMRREIHDGPMLSITLFTRGYHRLVNSDYAGARRSLEATVTEGERTGSTFAVAWARRFLMAIDWSVGDAVSAEREFTTASALFRQLNERFALGSLRAELGAAILAQGRLDEADSIFRLALAASEASGVAEGVFTARTDLAAVQAERGHWTEAQAEVEQAIAYGKTHGHEAWLGSLQYTLGLLALRQHDLPGAQRHLTAALASSGPTQYLDHYAIHSRMAELELQRGQLPRALREITTASNQLDSLRNTLDDQQLKLMVFQTRIGFDELDFGLATIAAALARGGSADAAFRLSEQRRARTLNDRLVQAELLEADSLTPAARASIQRGAVDVAAVRAALPDDSTALLEYLAGPRGQPTTLFVVTRGGLRAAVLAPLDSLQDDVIRFAELLQSGASGSAVGNHLRQALVDSALALLPAGITRLLIVPDGSLHRLPFDALPLPDGAPLLTRYAVSMAPSAAVALTLWARPGPAAGSRLLALGDPSFANERTGGDDSRAETYRSAFDESGGLTRLEASAAEAREVARFSPDAVVRLRGDASESYLKRTALIGFSIIHLATHAIVDERTEARTAIALAPGDGDDGFLGTAELAELRLRAEIVVLSACRTARGVMVGGEGEQGLTSPLLAAGARSVVATIWSVGDRSTGPVMEDFYRGLAQRKTVSEALREAKLAAIARGAPPAAWAGFEVIGDPLARVPLREPASRAPWYLAIGAALLILLWAYRKFRAGAA